MPVFSFSGSLVAVSAALGRGHRATPLAQFLTCQYARRYLICLTHGNVDLWVTGGIGLFSAFWRYLTSPSDEVYWHPLAQN